MGGKDTAMDAVINDSDAIWNSEDRKQYELSNYLENELAMLSDSKLWEMMITTVRLIAAMLN